MDVPYGEILSTLGDYASDKLVALAGIAERFGDALRTKYIAGFWEDRLLDYLMWHPKSGATATTSYRAPSWSWASLDGAIAWDYDSVDSLDQSDYRAYNCRILRCRITLKNQLLPYGEVNGGHIELSAVMRRAWYGDPLPYGELHWLESASAFGKPFEDVPVFRWLRIRGNGTSSEPLTYGSMDIRLPSATTSWYHGEVFYVALLMKVDPEKDWRITKGLMLMHKGNAIYERIGWFCASASFDGFPLQTITII